MFWTPLSRIFPALVALTCVAAFSACKTNDIPSGAHYIVSVAKTPFYKFGPAQDRGPDFSLTEGTKIIMLEHSFGFSRVMTADGTSGWVPTDDLKPAPPGPFTTSATAKTNYTVQLNRSMFDQGKPPVKHSDPPLNGPGLFNTGDNPLPQNPNSSTPAPGFHY